MRYLFIGVWGILVVALVVISMTYKRRSEAMIAEVDSQVTAVSYQKAVLVKQIYAVPGQEINPGDTLIVVTRPDLELDIEKKRNELKTLELEFINHESAINGKKELQRLNFIEEIQALKLKEQLAQAEIVQRNQIEQVVGARMATQDSLLISQLLFIQKSKQIKTAYYNSEMARLETYRTEHQQLLERKREILEKELDALIAEKANLVSIAKFQGTLGTINVQLDELVPPYKTLLSIYDISPTLIRAFVNEQTPFHIQAGDDVLVVSENRQYSISGKVQEIGGRITSFPAKIEPFQQTKSYGQEIFIQIAANNQFLNGEKVYVYPAKK